MEHLLLLANVYNPDVTYADSAVRRLETRVKAEFKDKRERGDERINVSIELKSKMVTFRESMSELMVSSFLSSLRSVQLRLLSVPNDH